MTRQDWRDLVYWMSAAGAVLTAMLLCHAVAAVVVRMVDGIV